MSDPLELESFVSRVEDEFGASVSTRRMPLRDGSGYVVRFEPIKKKSASVTVDYAEGIFTVDIEGVTTFDGYDSPRNDETWAMAIIRRLATEGFAIEQVTLLGFPVGKRVVWRSGARRERHSFLRYGAVREIEPWTDVEQCT